MPKPRPQPLLGLRLLIALFALLSLSMTTPISFC